MPIIMLIAASAVMGGWGLGVIYFIVTAFMSHDVGLIIAYSFMAAGTGLLPIWILCDEGNAR